jgi:predicted RNase H-like HicB family nuclease
MKKRNFSVLIEKDEHGFFVATVPALKSCYTQAETLDELYPRIQEVIELCLEVETEDDIPELEFVALQQFEVAV